MEQERIPYYKQTTSMGDCVVVETLEVVDSYPQIMVSGLPIWLEEEMQLLRNMDKETRQKAWQARTLAIAQEIVMRQQDSSRDVHGRSWDGKTE